MSNKQDEELDETIDQIDVEEAMNDEPAVENDMNDSEPVAEPIEQDGSTSSLVIPSKPSHKKRNVLIALLLLLLIGGGAGAYLYMNQQKPEAKVQTTKKETSATAKSTLVAEALIKEIQKQIEGEMSSDGNTAPPHKVDGYDYYARTDIEYQTKITAAQDKSEDALESIRNILIEKGYSESVTQDGKNGGMFEAEFTGENALCYVFQISGAMVDTQGSTAGATCADIETYAPTAEKIKPLADAYKKSAEYRESSEYLYTGLKIEQSTVSGYSRAQVGIGGVDTVGGFAGLFYKTPDGEWQYFLGTQNNLACTEFSTADIRKSYAGTDCFDVNDELTTVKA